MLRLLADNETAVRRSGNGRLVVETLLLRWAMLDRVVDLQEVLERGRPSPPPKGASTPPAPAPPRAPDAAPPTPPGPPPATAEFSAEGLRSAWPAVVAAVRERKPFLGEAVASAEPAEVAAPWLTLRVPESGGFFVQPLQEQAALVEEIVSGVVGQPVQLRVVAGSSPVAGPGPLRRMSEASIRADRLTSLRAKDPTLDTAAEALDLEIVE
jgi:DNA polymerase-3 subunit gamma/tau